MGNEETRVSQQQMSIPNKRNNSKSYSLDMEQFANVDLEKLKVQREQYKMSKVVSSLELSAGLPELSADKALLKQSSLLISNAKKVSLKEQNAKLERLTKNNDELRRELMQINQKLREKLEKKKNVSGSGKIATNEGSKSKRYQSSATKNPRSSLSANQKPVISQHQRVKSLQKERLKSMGIRRQLQNAYSQAHMYRKQLQQLKKGQPPQAHLKLVQQQNQISLLQQEIISMQKTVESSRQVVEKQRKVIREYEMEMGSPEIQEAKKEIAELKVRLKKIKEVSRRKEKEEKVRHQMLIQMDRKVRELEGEYVPGMGREQDSNDVSQQRSRVRVGDVSRVMGSESRVNGEKRQVRKWNSSLNSHLPSDLSPRQKEQRYLPSQQQLQEIQRQLSQLKQHHQTYHYKLSLQQSKRNAYHAQTITLNTRLSQITHKLQQLNYKKDRYMQLIMNGVNSGQELSYDGMVGGQAVIKEGEIVVKGQDLQGQRVWSDVGVVRNFDMVKGKVKIVTVNVWVDGKLGITAIQCFYTDDEQFFIGQKSCQPEANTTKHTLQLQQNDYLLSIMGTFNSKTKFLQFLRLESFKGRTLKVGKEQLLNNDNFSVRLARGQRPVMIGGAWVKSIEGCRINRLDMMVGGID